MNNTPKSPSNSARPSWAPTTSFGRLLLSKQTGQEFVPSPISFRDSERHHAEARRGGRPAPHMAVQAFADYQGLPLRLIESYIKQGFMSVYGDEDSHYVEVKLAKRELSAIGRRIKSRTPRKPQPGPWGRIFQKASASSFSTKLK
jgi:hypothetical protein